ncbi:hypothetical protein BT93_H2032 [Corymbia citriodora subsp. variegata]|nr:hypothetical protein BT93_H2032 [Corymbia citriodora subsp. variegata]
MEDSRSMKKPVPDDHDDEGGEESGWTTYLQDFSRNDDGEDSFCSGFRTSSLVSDAASRAVHKNAVAEPKAPMRLSMIKRTRTREITDEDPLEDTATSPVNSPKINHLKRMEMMGSRMTDEPLHLSLGNGGALKARDSNENEKMMYSCDGQDYECSSLRKRGLCLVPLSMFMNYQHG